MIENNIADEKYTINGKDFDIIGYVSTNEQGKVKQVGKNTPGAVPLVDIKIMSDFKWQYGCLMSRLEHPERYEDIDEDVTAAVENLKQWLIVHIECISELKPEERKKLLRALHKSDVTNSQ